jgi:hypothetical protein
MPAVIQIELPTETLVQLEKVARQKQCTVDELVREMILHELPGLPSLPDDIETELAAFDHLFSGYWHTIHSAQRNKRNWLRSTRRVSSMS